MQIKLLILRVEDLFGLTVVLVAELADPLLKYIVVLLLLSQLLKQVRVLFELILADLLQTLDFLVQLVYRF